MNLAIGCANWPHFYGSLCLLFAALLFSSAEAQDDELTAYVGTYTGRGSEGIYAFRFNTASGKSNLLGLAASTDNPSFLAVDPGGQCLYAVNEVESFMKQRAGAISVFSVEPGSGTLKSLQQISSLGSGPAHVSLDRSARFLLVANYGGGSVAVFPIRLDGRLGDHSAFMQAHGSSVNKERQEAPHAHYIQTTPDNRFAVTADLGLDKLLVYDFDERTGTLTEDSARNCIVDPGAGPRHFVFAPSGRFVFVVNELTSSVTRFAYDAAEGALTKKETVSTLPPGFAETNTTAEIIVDRKGKFLYVSNRGDDSIVQFSIDPESGGLTFVQRIPCGGKTPRHIALDPTGRWLFSANQNSNRISIFQVRPDDGRLTPTSQTVSIVSPVCVTFVSKP